MRRGRPSLTPALSTSWRGSRGGSSPEARVAQLVEHSTENAGVAGSIPSPGTDRSLLPFEWLEIFLF